MQPISLGLPSQQAWHLDALPPLALYVHFPWCVRKCPYCDFNSHDMRGGFDEVRYVDALIRDIELALPSIWGRRVTSIFMGGGTPSLFSAAQVGRFLDAVHALLKMDPNAEITLEANPGTAEADKFRDFRAAGVNRLSIGVQSFDPQFLSALGRIHGREEAQTAARLAAEHFETFNLDLMYALPSQSVAQALADVEMALSFGPTHLSAYHLTIEPNTYFAVNVPQNLPDDDVSADMQEAIEARLAKAGFLHYETSAFALPNHYSRHNLNYWMFGDYLGIGAGAHSKLSFHDHIRREMREKQPAAYLAAVDASSPVAVQSAIRQEALPFEFMMNALRLTDGFEPALFAERTGLPLASVLKELNEAERRGLLARSVHRIQPSIQGQRFLNDLLTLFLRDEA